MRALPPPDPTAWRARAEWFWRAHDANRSPHQLDLGPRAAALLDELELVFAAGAWQATIILAWTIVEAERRAVEGAGGRFADTPDLDWLRERRNAIVHVGGGGAETVIADEQDLEETAQGAVRVVFRTLFASLWR